MVVIWTVVCSKMVSNASLNYTTASHFADPRGTIILPNILYLVGHASPLSESYMYFRQPHLLRPKLFECFVVFEQIKQSHHPDRDDAVECLRLRTPRAYRSLPTEWALSFLSSRCSHAHDASRELPAPCSGWPSSPMSFALTFVPVS